MEAISPSLHANSCKITEGESAWSFKTSNSFRKKPFMKMLHSQWKFVAKKNQLREKEREKFSKWSDCKINPANSQINYRAVKNSVRQSLELSCITRNYL